NHELYNPTTGSWSAAPSPAPSNHGTVVFVTLLPSGLVWVGNNDELFNRSTEEWTPFGPPSCGGPNVHCSGGGLLANGQVLVAGGDMQVEVEGPPTVRFIFPTIKAAFLWDPATLAWTSTGDLAVSRMGQTMTTLLDGQVLVAGGETFVKSSQRQV